MSDIPKTADQVFDYLRAALDGIEALDEPERERLIGKVGRYRDLGMWGLPGVEVMIGIHNKCVLECKQSDPTWSKADFFVP